MVVFLDEDGTEEMPVHMNNVNQKAYLEYKSAIDAKYPKGWFVAIHEGQIAADADTFEGVTKVLAAKGLDSPDVMVVQSGDDTDFLWIL